MFDGFVIIYYMFGVSYQEPNERVRERKQFIYGDDTSQRDERTQYSHETSEERAKPHLR